MLPRLPRAGFGVIAIPIVLIILILILVVLVLILARTVGGLFVHQADADGASFVAGRLSLDARPPRGRRRRCRSSGAVGAGCVVGSVAMPLVVTGSLVAIGCMGRRR